MLFARFAICVSLCFFAGHCINYSDTGLLDGLMVQALSIICAVAITSSFFFLQGLHDAIARTTEQIDKLRKELNLDPLGLQAKQSIRARFQSSGHATYLNSVALLVFVSIYTSAAALSRMDFPVLSWPSGFWWSKLQFIHGVAFSCFFLAILATYDILSTTYMATRIGREET